MVESLVVWMWSQLRQERRWLFRPGSDKIAFQSRGFILSTHCPSHPNDSTVPRCKSIRIASLPLPHFKHWLHICMQSKTSVHFNYSSEAENNTYFHRLHMIIIPTCESEEKRWGGYYDSWAEWRVLSFSERPHDHHDPLSAPAPTWPSSGQYTTRRPFPWIILVFI